MNDTLRPMGGYANDSLAERKGVEAKVELSISNICAAANKLLTAEEVAGLPKAPEIPDGAESPTIP
jgi:hypothetical protein